LVGASLAASSDFSFQGMFLWAGIQKIVTDNVYWEETFSWMCSIISLDDLRLFIARIELRESLAIKNDSVFFHCCSIRSSYVKIARASIVKIELYSSEENLNISSSDIIAKPGFSLDFERQYKEFCGFGSHSV